jgi:hypothetical protein
MPKIEEMTLEEKVDELLMRQRRQQKFAIVRGIMSFMIFFVLVILPIWGFYYALNYLKQSAGFDFSQISETLNNFKSLEKAESLINASK